MQTLATDAPAPSPGALHALPRVRPALAADLPAIAAIYAELVRQGGAPFEDTPPDLREVTVRRERLAVQGYPCLVAELDGAVAGFAVAAPYGLRPAWRSAVEGSVCVRRDAAGRGVGRALLAGLIAACGAKGFRQMLAVVRDGDAAALGLYRALGFERAGVLRAVVPHPAGGGWVDAALLQRALADDGGGAIGTARAA